SARKSPDETPFDHGSLGGVGGKSNSRFFTDCYQPLAPQLTQPPAAFRVHLIAAMRSFPGNRLLAPPLYHLQGRQGLVFEFKDIEREAPVVIRVRPPALPFLDQLACRGRNAGISS